MSLAGSLSDLALPELLQVVALSRKTGTLEICSEAGVAWLGLRDGGIVRVAGENGALNAFELLKQHGLEGEPDSDVAAATLWDAAVGAILRIFEWTEGEFTFEADEDPAHAWRGPEGIILPTALSPEFLVLEGARLEDEASAFESPEDAFEHGRAVSEAGDFGEAPPSTAEAEPVFESDLRAHALDPEIGCGDFVGPEDFVELEEILDAEEFFGDHEIIAAEPIEEPSILDAPVERLPAPMPAAAPLPEVAAPGVLICVDSELALLEAIKDGLAEMPTRVHIFQDAGAALERLKQYVVKGVFPVLVVSSRVEDPLEARKGLGWRRLAERIRAMAPRLRIALIVDADVGPIQGIECFERPDDTLATEAQIRDFAAMLLAGLGIHA